MAHKYERRTTKTCPECGTSFMPKGGRQTCCSRRCARFYDWKHRKPKQLVAAGKGYLWHYVENHPFAVRLHKKMRPHGGYILEHRYVMEQTLGRPMERHERVHHKNGNRADNRPENLELWTQRYPNAQKDPAGVRFADFPPPHCPTCTCGQGH